MLEDVTRTALIRGTFCRNSSQIRPPWAVRESLFVDACTRCEDCAAGCPEGIISKGGGGFPIVSFDAGECTFCGVCAAACAVGVLVIDRNQNGAPNTPWNLQVTVAEDCLSKRGVVCRICEEQCEARAICFANPGGLGQPLIDASRCTGCGACVAPCPSRSISLRPVAAEEEAA